MQVVCCRIFISTSDGLCTGNMAMRYIEVESICRTFLIVGTFNPKLDRTSLLCFVFAFSFLLRFSCARRRTFKLIVSDSDSVIGSLSREVKEISVPMERR